MVMQILLPNDIDGLKMVEEKLNHQNIQEMFEKQKYKTKVRVKLPKFRIEQTIPLNGPLMSMGMKDMFDKYTANFSGIDGGKSPIWMILEIDVVVKG